MALDLRLRVRHSGHEWTSSDARAAISGMAVPQRKRRGKGAGALRQLPSGRWQARLRGTDGAMRPAPMTFDTKLDAGAWLKGQASDVDRDVWRPPTRQHASQTVKDYAETWLACRELKPRTRAHYRELLDAIILPHLGDAPLDRVTPSTVRAWYGELHPEKPTIRAHAYGLLRGIFTTAVADDLVIANPCRIRGASSTRTRHQPKVASLPELEVMVEAMPTRYRPMVLLAAWCGLRFGELAELRRGDVDVEAGVLRVQRGVARAGGQVYIGDPKSQAGRRTVSVPPHLTPM